MNLSAIPIWLLNKIKERMRKELNLEEFDQTFLITYNNYDRAIDNEDRKNVWYITIMPMQPTRNHLEMMVLHFVSTRQEGVDYALQQYTESYPHVTCPVVTMTRIDKETLVNQLKLL